MNKLEDFINKLSGTFNNDSQINKEEVIGEVKHPKAKHINGVCNNKIENLQNDFNGYFVIEESYYEQGKFKNILLHLWYIKKRVERMNE